MQRQNVIRNEHLLKLTVLYRLGVSDIAEAVGMLNENEIRVNWEFVYKLPLFIYIFSDFCQTSYLNVYTGPVFTEFAETVELWL